MSWTELKFSITVDHVLDMFVYAAVLFLTAHLLIPLSYLLRWTWGRWGQKFNGTNGGHIHGHSEVKLTNNNSEDRKWINANFSKTGRQDTGENFSKRPELFVASGQVKSLFQPQSPAPDTSTGPDTLLSRRNQSQRTDILNKEPTTLTHNPLQTDPQPEVANTKCTNQPGMKGSSRMIDRIISFPGEFLNSSLSCGLARDEDVKRASCHILLPADEKPAIDGGKSNVCIYFTFGVL